MSLPGGFTATADYASLQAGKWGKELVDEAMDSLRSAGCAHPRIKLTASVGIVPQMLTRGAMQRMEAYCSVCDLSGKAVTALTDFELP